MDIYKQAIKKIIEQTIERNYTDVDWPFCCQVSVNGIGMIIRCQASDKSQAIDRLMTIFCEAIIDGEENE